MKHILYHILIPAVLPIAFLINAMIPVEVLGNGLRTTISLCIAFFGSISGLGAAIMGNIIKMHEGMHDVWWFISSLILGLPFVGYLVLR